ncbi:hypothetical protein [Roseibium sp. RKSG952]|uniref:hypothetical protein n=1 Tax=Roseibium sp. RKSG952 TaxID=2529384 RepID=UPI0012BB5E54|nr:hypothetical protein [Roseibium sp. RKSG952]MTH96127.1 hypothetical protein [Roseibium sp. RKSG952]
MNHPITIDFARIAKTALMHSDSLCRRWLPHGRQEGQEWVTRNPRRTDHRPGSFKVNLSTGKWADFATGDKGGDLVALAAFLFDLSQKQAALRIAHMLGIDPYA